MHDPTLLCPACGAELAPNLLTCPTCRRLVHSDRLKALAEAATQAGNPVDALVAWREALTLLPRDSRQHEAIQAKIAELGRVVDSLPASSRAADRARGATVGKAAGLGAVGVLIWKFSGFLLLALSKVKLLLLGLTKASTFSSMLLSFSVYWSVFGWPLALGLVISIYIHEMGHVAALMRYGVKATAPMFIPGLGALIRLQQALDDPRQNARCGLAGPLWGLAAALGAYALHLITGLPIFLAIANLGAFINLFNLLPFASLDGGRAFQSLNKSERWLAVVGLIAILPFCAGNEVPGLLILLIIGGVFTILTGKAPNASDRPGLAAYLALVAALTLIVESLAPMPPA